MMVLEARRFITAVADKLRPRDGSYRQRTPAVASGAASARGGSAPERRGARTPWLGLIGENRPTADFFADLGKLLLMFFAGLEIDLARFRQAQQRTIVFGLLTTALPQLLAPLPFCSR
jgi:hypothetical protein